MTTRPRPASPPDGTGGHPPGKIHPDPAAFRRAVPGLDWPAIRQAVLDGVDLDSADDDGVTALMIAAGQRVDHDLCRFLIEHGADPARRDRQGRTAADHIRIPPEPPETWENGHEAWVHSDEAWLEGWLADQASQGNRK